MGRHEKYAGLMVNRRAAFCWRSHQADKAVAPKFTEASADTQKRSET